MARGRKPNLENVIPFKESSAAQTEKAREAAIARVVKRLMPATLSKEEQDEWKRVARVLADPTVDRLKARFVDTIAEYCRVVVRLKKLREAFPTLSHEIYRVEAGRNGTQVKAHPFVAQINECWRQWRSLVGMLGLSPADERSILPGQGDLFDDAEKYFSGGG
jgi:P27 family predicted phage terminase small subunit